MLKNKKGNFSDIVTWMRFIIAFVIVAGIVLLFVKNFDSNIQTMDNETVPQQVKDISSTYSNFLHNPVDYLFIMIFMVFVVFSVMAARLIPSTPKYVVVAIFVMILLPFVALMIENIWDAWYQQAYLTVIFDTMTFLPFVMNNLVYFVLFYSGAVAISLLTKENG